MKPLTAARTDSASSDSELASRVASGDHQAFRLLMQRYNQMLFRAARGIVKDDAEAEDAVQEAYLLAYRGIGKFRAEAKLSTWLVRIVVNEAIARTRLRSRRAEVIPLDGDRERIDETAEASMDVVAPEQPEHGAMRSDTRRLLEKTIDGLPDVFRAVFVLRALEEMTVDETAAVLDIPVATVRTRFFRARGLMREALAREIDFAMEDAFAFAGERCDRIVAGVLARLEKLQAPKA